MLHLLAFAQRHRRLPIPPVLLGDHPRLLSDCSSSTSTPTFVCCLPSSSPPTRPPLLPTSLASTTPPPSDHRDPYPCKPPPLLFVRLPVSQLFSCLSETRRSRAQCCTGSRPTDASRYRLYGCRTVRHQRRTSPSLQYHRLIFLHGPPERKADLDSRHWVGIRLA